MTTGATKLCCRCKTPKPFSEFYINKRGRAAGKPAGQCKQCAKDRANEWFSQNRERVNARQRQYNAANRAAVRLHRIKSYYGLTKEQYLAMEKSCAICGAVSDLCIDHSHQKGTVRGMLCGGCNRGLGQFRDSPELLLRAAEYLKR